jgi:hypothetical protein
MFSAGLEVWMWKSLTLLAGLLVGAPVAAPCEGVACRCREAADEGQTEQEFFHARRDRADRIVKGTVIRLDTLSKRSYPPQAGGRSLIVARIRVHQVWRGPRTDTMTVVLTALEDRSSCDMILEPASEYLVFAIHRTDSLLTTRMCWGTERIDRAGDALAVLGPGTPVRP